MANTAILTVGDLIAHLNTKVPIPITGISKEQLARKIALPANIVIDDANLVAKVLLEDGSFLNIHIRGETP